MLRTNSWMWFRMACPVSKPGSALEGPSEIRALTSAATAAIGVDSMRKDRNGQVNGQGGVQSAERRAAGAFNAGCCREGDDIIAVDICEEIETTGGGVPLALPGALDETARDGREGGQPRVTEIARRRDRAAQSARSMRRRGVRPARHS